MAMNASVSAIQDMEKTLADTVRNLDTLSEKISTNFRPSADWNDNQAVAYNQVMPKDCPVGQITDSGPEKATGKAETTGGTGTELSEPPV